MDTSLSLDSNYSALIVLLERIEALFDVATSADTTEIDPKSITNYFWVLDDLLHKAKAYCNALASINILKET